MKTMLLTISILILVSSGAFAEWSTSISLTDNTTLNMSKNVNADFKASNPATPNGTDYQDYSAATYNGAGTKIYGGASGMEKIKFQKCTDEDCAKNAPDSPVSNGDSSDFPSSEWTDL
ncbi:hypothetical protein LF845_04580 [Deferribacterales bacterium Es71-Z0220]|uniref:hypothetical protein n=1 Tax=Deferrivibrio essentukiensis TaxID=2880922 RepID=UPI001F60E755|nr:hypothetical protein [Deferrivibrio essentukiensis]MCB4204234.1 hypothetical protein [Deferrivibrio essentukiensis]